MKLLLIYLFTLYFIYQKNNNNTITDQKINNAKIRHIFRAESRHF